MGAPIPLPTTTTSGTANGDWFAGVLAILGLAVVVTVALVLANRTSKVEQAVKVEPAVKVEEPKETLRKAA